MTEVSPKDFIKIYLIETIDKVIIINPYLSFALLSTSIEFIGKCYNSNQEWNDNNAKPKADFNKGLKKIGLNYVIYTDLLRDSIRNGFAHSFKLKGGVSLTDRETNINPHHPHLSSDEKYLYVVVEDFWEDIKKALQVILSLDFSKKTNDKMNKAFFRTIP